MRGIRPKKSTPEEAASSLTSEALFLDIFYWLPRQAGIDLDIQVLHRLLSTKRRMTSPPRLLRLHSTPRPIGNPFLLLII